MTVITTLVLNVTSLQVDFCKSGITPYISNEVGMFVDTTFSSLGENPRNAVAGGNSAKIHRLRSSTGEDNYQTKVAFPNDRSQSIRPSDRHGSYK